MKDIINIVLLAFVIISILCQPLFLVHGMNTFLGKMITLIVIIGATMYHTMSGLLLALLFICFRMIHVEGMENKKEKNKEKKSNKKSNEDDDENDDEDDDEADKEKDNNKESDEEDDEDDEGDEDNEEKSESKHPSIDKILTVFRKKNCKDGMLIDSDGNKINMKDIKKHFPDISFTGEKCNPCDSSCEFQITSSKERIMNEENMRPKPSNELPVNKKDAHHDDDKDVQPHEQ